MTEFSKVVSMSKSERLQPRDDFNLQLEANVAPAAWKNPVPSDRYNLVVIGAGTAGLVTAAGAAGLGAKVALIERHLMGGDCLNFGCVPSKAVIGSARAAAAVRDAERFGIHSPHEPSVDFAAVMQRMRRLRAAISPNDSAERFQELGVDVFLGDACFVNSDTVQVGDTKLKFRRAVIATGARAVVPSIPGLSSVPYLTNETLFSLTERPGRLGVIGAGPIGCEMAQAFARLGSEVFLVETGHGILPKEDRDAAAIVEGSMKRDGVRLLCCGRDLQVDSSNGTQLVLTSHGNHQQFVDQLLISTGRTPNVEALKLDAVECRFRNSGAVVNDYMQTTNPVIYAAGDVCSSSGFTTLPISVQGSVSLNALFRGRKRASSLVIPWCTYTSPEVAHVGLHERQAREQNIEVDVYVQQLRDVDRAILDGDEVGFVKVLVRKGTDRILGATIVASHAGEMISEITLAMTHGLGLSNIGSTIHPYPTQTDAIRKLGDQYSRTRLTPLVKSLFQKWLKWTR
ncbi:MAG: mercuric reductase [Planctomycetaceae bacterium]